MSPPPPRHGAQGDPGDGVSACTLHETARRGHLSGSSASPRLPVVDRLPLSSRDIGTAVWPTDNEYGVPVLRLDLQVDRLDAPVCRWGRERRKSRMRGTWHFYTEDYRFSRLWERPTDLVNSGCVATVEPNWSVHEQTPRAVALWQTYRKRWLARTWQELGVRVIVDLNVAESHAETNLLGVPRGWRAYATRGSVERLEDIDRELELARERAGARDVLFLVYGGGKAVQARCLEHHLVWIPEEADVARGRHGT